MFKNIPAEMQAFNQWVCWRLETTPEGRTTKIPYNPRSGRMASTTDPTTWSSFDQVVAAVADPKYHNNPFSGIGFVFGFADPYTGVDLDIKPDTDQATIDMLFSIAAKFDSYSELSPSGLGLHIIIRAKLPGKGRKRLAVEMYDRERYFTFTGNVINNKFVINDCQELAEQLYDEMGAAASEITYEGKPEATEQDYQVLEKMQRAKNSDKFNMLWAGDISAYRSPSDADQALMNFLGEFSGNPEQMIRMFRLSALGKREKAQRDSYLMYSVRKSFDMNLAPIDMDRIRNNAIEALANASAKAGHEPAADADTNVAVPLGDAAGSIVDGFDVDLWRTQRPPQTIAMITDYIMAQAQRPVRELSLAAALSFLAGLCGRCYNVSGTGLNLYVMALAETGRGKEAMAQGLNKIAAAVCGNGDLPAIYSFFGPADMASGTGLLRHLSEALPPSFVSITGEIGLRLQQMSAKNANSADITLRKVLLDIYSKSGAGQIVRPSVYADKKNNVEMINSPAFTWLGESTPSEFYKGLDESQIKSGLLPRFVIVEYDGPRVEYNEQHERARVSQELKASIRALADTVIMLNQQGKIVDVEFSESGWQAQKIVNDYADHQINSSDNQVFAHLWNRHHLKVLKIAGLLAVAHNPNTPIIDDHMIAWAHSLCMTDTIKIMARFETGDVGGEHIAQDNEQIKRVMMFMQGYMNGKGKHDATRALLMEHYAVTKTLISQSVRPYKCFDVPGGQTRAITNCLNEMIAFGYIQKMNAQDTMKFFGNTAETYVFTKTGIHAFNAIE